MAGDPFISVRDLSIGYGSNVVQKNLNFDIRRNDIFFVIGGSGCGKTTLLKSMIDLYPCIASGEGNPRRPLSCKWCGDSYRGARMNRIHLEKNFF